MKLHCQSTPNTKCEKWFDCLRKVLNPVEIIRQMQAQYGDNCLLRSKIYDWIDHFKKGRTSVCDEEG
jgi:hypothetical protein